MQDQIRPWATKAQTTQNHDIGGLGEVVGAGERHGIEWVFRIDPAGAGCGCRWHPGQFFHPGAALRQAAHAQGHRAGDHHLVVAV